MHEMKKGQFGEDQQEEVQPTTVIRNESEMEDEGMVTDQQPIDPREEFKEGDAPRR